MMHTVVQELKVDDAINHKLVYHVPSSNSLLFVKQSMPNRLYIWPLDKDAAPDAESLDCLEFDSSITAIGECPGYILIGDSDGYVTMLSVGDMLGEPPAEPLYLDGSEVVKFKDCFVQTKVNWYRLNADYDASINDVINNTPQPSLKIHRLEFPSQVNDLVRFDSLPSWPLEALSLNHPTETLLCVGEDSPCMALYREDHELNLSRLANVALSIFTKKKEAKKLESTSMLLVERLDDPGRKLNVLFKLGRYVVACDFLRAQLLFIEPVHMLIVHHLKGYRDVVCWEADSNGGFYIVSNKRKVVEKWSTFECLSKDTFAPNLQVICALGEQRVIALKGDSTLQLLSF